MSYSVAPVYSATKSGVRAYTQVLRLQLEDINVKVFEMVPPGVKTNLQNDWAVQPNPGMMMDADKMVRVCDKRSSERSARAQTDDDQPDKICGKTCSEPTGEVCARGVQEI